MCCSKHNMKKLKYIEDDDTTCECKKDRSNDGTMDRIGVVTRQIENHPCVCVNVYVSNIFPKMLILYIFVDLFTLRIVFDKRDLCHNFNKNINAS